MTGQPRFECPYTPEPIRHGLDTPTPVVSVFDEAGCTVLADIAVVNRNAVRIVPGYFDLGGQWVDLPASRVVVER